MTDPGTDLDRQDPAKPLPVLAGDELRAYVDVAEALFLSGNFPDVKKRTDALSRILFGRDLGLSPTEAMQQIFIVDGKPSISANLQASRVKASGKYDYQITELTNESCSIEFFEYFDAERATVGFSIFTMEDAERAGLVKDKSPWKKYPRNMLFARAVSNGVAWYCPDVMGGLRVYHEGEIEVRDVSAGSGDYTEPEDLRAAIEEWAPSQHWASVIATTIEHARKLGHAGYSDYGSVELALKGQAPDFLMRWVSTAEEALSQFVAARPSEDESLTAEILESRALQKIDEADALEAEAGTDPLTNEQVEELRAEAASLHDQAEELKTKQNLEAS